MRQWPRQFNLRNNKMGHTQRQQERKRRAEKRGEHEAKENERK